MSTRKERRKSGTKEWGEIFRMKEENENISFNFYQQVLMPDKIEIQIQLCKYWNCSPSFSYLFFKFYFFSFLRVHFLCFHSIFCWFISIFRSRHWKLFCKTAARQYITKIVNFFYKIGFSFQYSLLNKKVYKYTSQ